MICSWTHNLRRGQQNSRDCTRSTSRSNKHSIVTKFSLPMIFINVGETALCGVSYGETIETHCMQRAQRFFNPLGRHGDTAFPLFNSKLALWHSCNECLQSSCALSSTYVCIAVDKCLLISLQELVELSSADKRTQLRSKHGPMTSAS